MSGAQYELGQLFFLAFTPETISCMSELLCSSYVCVRQGFYCTNIILIKNKVSKVCVFVNSKRIRNTACLSVFAGVLTSVTTKCYARRVCNPKSPNWDEICQQPCPHLSH